MKNKIRCLPLMLIPLALLGCGLAGPESTERRSLPTLTMPPAGSLSSTSPPPPASATPFRPASASPTENTLTASDTPAGGPLETPAPASPASTSPAAIDTVEAPAPTSPCSAPNGRENWALYTVRAGDTLFALAQSTGTSVGEIQQANCLSGNVIFIGQPLYLPFVPPPATDAPPAPTTVSPTESSTSATAAPSDTVEATSKPPPTDEPTSAPSPSDTVEAPPAPGPGDPALIVTPESGPPETTFTISIENFNSNETILVEVTFQFLVVFTEGTVADSNGNATVFYISPKDAMVGTYVVNAHGEVKAASGEFTITAPP